MEALKIGLVLHPLSQDYKVERVLDDFGDLFLVKNNRGELLGSYFENTTGEGWISQVEIHEEVFDKLSVSTTVDAINFILRSL